MEKMVLKGAIYAAAMGVSTANAVYQYVRLKDDLEDGAGIDTKFKAFLKGASTALSVTGSTAFLMLLACVYIARIDNPGARWDIVWDTIQ